MKTLSSNLIKKTMSSALFMVFSLSATAHVHAEVVDRYPTTAAAKAVPEGVCVFDLDDTLVILNEKTGRNEAAPEAAASVQKCIDANYAIAIASASTREFRKGNLELIKDKNGVPVLNQSRWSSIDKLQKNSIQKNYTNFNDTKPYVNPLYIGSTNSDRGSKGQAMNRIMRTFFGYATNPDTNAYVDLNNAYAGAHNPLKNISGCMVLFDDLKLNIDAVNAFNKNNNLNFAAIQVNEKVGVTVKDVTEGFKRMAANCKK